MFDNTCKFLAENFSADFANWLLGEPISLTKIEPSELSLEPIRADSIIFLESTEIVLHLEFQTEPRSSIPFRMADYYLRLHRKFPQRKLHQVVIYLTPSRSELVYQANFILPELNHRFNVIRLWEQPTAIFQKSLGLMPLAVLTKTPNPVETLTQIAQTIETISDPREQSNVAAATAIMSGLKLDKTIIQRLLRSDIMKESVIYQEILLEGEAKGEAKGEARGKAEGKAEATLQIARNMIRSGMTIEAIAELTGLAIEQIQKLR